MVPFALHAVANTPAGRMELIRSYDSTRFGLPRNRGGSAPALVFSRPAQRLLTLRPACSPSRLCDPLHRRLQQLRCLRCCFDCYRVERTSSRAVIHPLWTTTFSRRTRLHGLPGLDAAGSCEASLKRGQGLSASVATRVITLSSECLPRFDAEFGPGFRVSWVVCLAIL